MGTAVLANSASPLNRERLAELLGFDRVRENSLDSSQVSTYDIPIEAANLASSSAIRVGAMIGDIHTQYHQIRPWLLLDEEATYTSSAMPQKRNPGLLMRARESASDVVGLAQAEAGAHPVHGALAVPPGHGVEGEVEVLAQAPVQVQAGQAWVSAQAGRFNVRHTDSAVCVTCLQGQVQVLVPVPVQPGVLVVSSVV